MRVFVCDDSESFCLVVGFWLEEADDIDLVGSATNRTEALQGLSQATPDVVLLDTMGADDGLGVDEVRAAAGDARIVVYSGHDAEAARQFVVGEPDAYVRKGDEPGHLIDALRAL
jgi:DNA-binding NarL/FixJ family response regulator